MVSAFNNVIKHHHKLHGVSSPMQVTQCDLSECENNQGPSYLMNAIDSKKVPQQRFE